MAMDSVGNLFVATGSTIQKIASAYAGAPVTLPLTIPGAYIPSMTVDVSGNLYFADYAHNTIDESQPPYATYTTIISGQLQLAVGVAFGP
jgi:hypothetical protein